MFKKIKHLASLPTIKSGSTNPGERRRFNLPAGWMTYVSIFIVEINEAHCDQ
jgi:hypothetical protein